MNFTGDHEEGQWEDDVPAYEMATHPGAMDPGLSWKEREAIRAKEGQSGSLRTNLISRILTLAAQFLSYHHPLSILVTGKACLQKANTMRCVQST
jgi:hypothetical protein